MSFLRFRGVSVTTIIVGEAEARFQAHKDLLCQKSPFFNGALNTNFKEASENAVTLPEDDPDTFERFLQWLYSGSFSLSGTRTDVEVDERYMQLAQLFTLADKLEMASLKHDIINEFFEMQKGVGKPPQTEVIAYVYENTRERSPLRKLMVAWLVWHIDFQWYTTPDAASFLSQCPEFAGDLAIALARRYVDFKTLSPFNFSPEKCYEEEPLFSPTKSTAEDRPVSRLMSGQKPTSFLGFGQPQSNAGGRSISISTAGTSVAPGSAGLRNPPHQRSLEPLRSPSLFGTLNFESAQPAAAYPPHNINSINTTLPP